MVLMEKLWKNLKQVMLDWKRMRKIYSLTLRVSLKEGKKREVVQMLDSCGFHSVIGIEILIEKSLLTIQHSREHMHDLLQQMGREIIRQQSQEPGECSRLWLSKGIFHVLVNKTGTKAVQVIMLDFLETIDQAQHYPKAMYVEQGVCQNGFQRVWNRISKLYCQVLPESKEAQCHPKAFSKMLNLRILKLYNLQLPQGLKHLPNSLRFIDWCGFPSRSLPPGFHPDELIELCMCHSNLEQHSSSPNSSLLCALQTMRL